MLSGSAEFQPLTCIAPSLSDFDGSGTIMFGSILSSTPSPEHVGHAPYGLLNENIRGASSSIEMLQSGQA